MALLYLEQEDAFWCLVAIVEGFMPRDYYTKTLLGSQVPSPAPRCLVSVELGGACTRPWAPCAGFGPAWPGRTCPRRAASEAGRCRRAGATAGACRPGATPRPADRLSDPVAIDQPAARSSRPRLALPPGAVCVTGPAAVQVLREPAC